ncbi:MMPL family transporter [Solirubrobacter phytolaccae]|uniref:MMPL family transporter n=1 Tax=Solirubrobacter phytolaccae TaxID=1404360 RepID=A0A9X3SD76_9ACTN|nr:MMPL family transporter [Solirubrobacter phytolaccae]MDA0179447.1 MMPL family transporter [Solirubrobacter phytolaccae]
MLAQILHYATTRPKRVIATWVVLGLALSALGAWQSFNVTTDDTAQFLPKQSESAAALRYARDAFDVREGTTTVTVLLARADGGRLTSDDRAAVASITDDLPRWRPDLEPLKAESDPFGVGDRAGKLLGSAAGPVAPDGRFQLAGVQWQANTTDPVALAAYRQFRDDVADQAATHRLRAGFTGGIASVADAAKASEVRQYLASILLFAAVLGLSLLFFRGVLAAVLPLLAIVVVGGAATGLIVAAALVFGFKLDTGTPQLITVVLVGVGIDYFLFLLFRLRERLRMGEDKRTAALHAAGRIGPVIASAALAIVAAFATLGIAQFGQFRVLGPAVAISVLVMLAAGVTLMPAIAAVSGRALFWPSKRWQEEPAGGLAERLGLRIATHPGRTALAVTAVLVALAAAALGTQSNYDLGSGGPSTAASRTADEIAATLPRGASDPQPVYVRADHALSAGELAPLRRALAGVDGVGDAGEAVLTADRRGAQIDVALDDEATSAAGMAVARGPLRDTARRAAPAGTTAMVAGNAAVFADVSDAIDHDLRLIFPLAAGLIGLILVVMLRSVVAPAYLLLAVALEFAATLGASVLVFQVLGGAHGVAFTLPLVLFLFVVALGTDYNILMTARLREEMLAGRSPREAVAEAVRRVAPAIAAAGLVLATSFGTLMLEPDQGARQMGFAMAFGILLASLVVSSVLVPALTALVGHKAWWPGRMPSASRPRALARRAR